MTNKKNLKEEFKDLDFDLTLIKIINEIKKYLIMFQRKS